MGWGIAFELPYRFDLKANSLEVIADEPQLGYHKPVSLPIQRKDIIIFPQGREQFYEFAPAWVVEPGINRRKNSAHVSRGWHEAIALYPSWGKFQDRVESFVKDEVIPEVRHCSKLHALYFDVCIDAVYSHVLEAESIDHNLYWSCRRSFDVIVYWRICVGFVEQTESYEYIVGSSQLRVRAARNTIACLLKSFCPNPQLKIDTRWIEPVDWLLKTKELLGNPWTEKQMC